MAAWVGCSAVSCTTGQILKAGARVAYCFLFTLSMILAWLMRDYGKPLLEKIPCMAPPSPVPRHESMLGEKKEWNLNAVQGLLNTLRESLATPSLGSRLSIASAWAISCASTSLKERVIAIRYITNTLPLSGYHSTALSK